MLRETVDILMEATPRDLNMASMVRDMVHQPGVLDVHDLHVWAIAGGMRALSAHVQVIDGPLSSCGNVLTGLNQLLQERYGIGHSTLQLECVECNPNQLYCTLNAEGGHAHGQPHTHWQDYNHSSEGPHIHWHDHTADGVDLHR